VVVLSLMWPSAATLLRCFTDGGNAAAIVEPFSRLVELPAANTHASRIDVLACSAGSWVAVRGWRRWARRVRDSRAPICAGD